MFFIPEWSLDQPRRSFPGENNVIFLEQFPCQQTIVSIPDVDQAMEEVTLHFQVLPGKQIKAELLALEVRKEL